MYFYLLLKDYKEDTRKLTEMGFNGEVFNLELPKVQPCEIPEGNEVKIQVIINKLSNK